MSEQPTGRLARTEAATRTVVLDLLGALILLGSIGAAVVAVVLPVNQLTQPGGATRVELSPEAQEQAVAAITGVPEGSWLEFVPDLYSMSLHVFELGWPLRLLSEAGTSLLLACLAGAGLLLFAHPAHHPRRCPVRPGQPAPAAPDRPAGPRRRPRRTGPRRVRPVRPARRRRPGHPQPDRHLGHPGPHLGSRPA